MSRGQRRPSFDSKEFRDLVKVAGREVSSAIEDAGAMGHHSTSGSIREDGFRSFLSKVLPDRFFVGTGFAFDAHDHVSRQLDIVVALQPPFGGVFRQHSLCRLPCEVVLAVIEVKKIFRIAELRQTLQNASSVRRLVPYGNQQFVPSRSKGAERQSKEHRCFCGVVALTSDIAIDDWASGELRRLRAESAKLGVGVDLLDRIVILDRGVINVRENKAQNNSGEREAVTFEWFLHLANHLDREAGRRPPIDLDIYAGGRSKWRDVSP
jgi:hypothetical protein